MRRFMTLMGVTLASFAFYSAFAPNAANAQYAQPYTVYSAPVVVPAYYSAPVYVSPPVTTYSVPFIQSSSYYAPTVSYYPSSAPVYATYAAPAVVAPAPGVYTTRTYYGLGIFRPRGYYTETTYAPVIR